LRVFLQDGTNDQSIYGGSWYLANQSMAKSLEYAGYEVKFEVGTEGHNSRHGASILPDALRWLWHGYPAPIVAAKAIKGDQRTITAFLDPDHDWELVGEGYRSAEGPAVDRNGNVYFCDAGASRIYKVGADGKVALFKENTGGATGLMFGADGRLYAAENASKRVVAYAPDGKLTVLATGVTPNDLAVTSKGEIYFTDSPARNVWHIDTHGNRHMVFNGDKDGNMGLPNGIRVTPDEALLAVDDTLTRATPGRSISSPMDRSPRANRSTIWNSPTTSPMGRCAAGPTARLSMTRATCSSRPSSGSRSAIKPAAWWESSASTSANSQASPMSVL
jgi:hypothetical protein